MVLKYYYDLMSQPSRALYIFLKINKIPFESCPIAIRKGEHMSEEFEKINRFKKLPAVDHSGFKLAESVAIFRYLAREFKDQIQPNWYPTDSKKAARVDEYLAWQHHNIRASGSLYFINKFVLPQMFGKETNEQKLAKLAENLEKSLNDLENIFLKDNAKFLCGDAITIADLLGSCEVEQPRAIGYDVFKSRPVLKAWMERVRNSTQPLYDEAHVVIKRMSDKKAKL